MSLNTFKEIHLRWSDMDPNFHVRHSVYYDLAAQLRMDFFEEAGVGAAYMLKHHFGPVLFREEALFHKEVKMGDKLLMNVNVIMLKRNFSRFSLRHQLMRGDDICTTISVEGAFIDSKLRKVTEPPEECREFMKKFPKASDFQWID